MGEPKAYTGPPFPPRVREITGGVITPRMYHEMSARWKAEIGKWFEGLGLPLRDCRRISARSPAKIDLSFYCRNENGNYYEGEDGKTATWDAVVNIEDQPEGT